jgi:hypothetical protein
MSDDYLTKIRLSRARRLARQEVTRQKQAVLASEMNKLGKNVRLLYLEGKPIKTDTGSQMRVTMKLSVDGKRRVLYGQGDDATDAMLEAVRYELNRGDDIPF